MIIERFRVTDDFVLKAKRQSNNLGITQILQIIILYITWFGSDIRVNKMTAHT